MKASEDEYPASMSDIIVRILAEHFKDPALAKTPRKRMGRPPKHDLVTA
jgi:hypothetical protein